MEYQVYSPWESQEAEPAVPFPPIEDDFWMSFMDSQNHFSAGLRTPSSPSELPDDHVYTPMTPLGASPTFEGPLFALPLDFSNPIMDVSSFLTPPSSITHDELPVFMPAHNNHHQNHHHQQPPTTPPNSLEHETGLHDPPSPFLPRAPPAKRPRGRRSATSCLPKTYRCDVDGCAVSFTSSRRDIERHKTSVHGPPVRLDCGESLSYRPDNIARHRKKCETCRLAHMLRSEEEGESRPRPGRKRKMPPTPGREMASSP